jgi:hypothetical protein
LPRLELLIGVLSLAGCEKSLVIFQGGLHLMKLIEHNGTQIEIACRFGMESLHLVQGG